MYRLLFFINVRDLRDLYVGRPYKEFKIIDKKEEESLY